VSTLASCGRLPATVPDRANRPRQLVFLTPIDSQLNDFLKEIHQIARSEPSIVERIDEDLDLHAKKKKLLRLADAEFLAGQTLDLPKLQLQLRELKIDDIELETSRPRTGGFLLAAHEFILRQKLDKSQLRYLNTEQLRGVELVDGVARLCAMNLLLHGIGGDADARNKSAFWEKEQRHDR
jgi:hypothetical protein